MEPSNLTRRDFTRLTAAAFGGLVAGSLAGCAKEEPKPAPKPGGAGTTPAAGGTPETVAAAKIPDHACRGLNECKTDKNACAGQSACATVTHECATKNTCKNLGGCGETAGSNECKGMGNCHVPMVGDHAEAWKTARKAFEARMDAAKKKYGDAPAAPAAPAEPEKKDS